MMLGLARGHMGKGHRMSHSEAQWLRTYGKSKTMIVDGRVLTVTKYMGHTVIDYFTGLKVYGHVPVDPLTGELDSDDYDFNRNGWSIGMLIDPVAIGREVLNETSLLMGYDQGDDFTIQFEYEDGYFR